MGPSKRADPENMTADVHCCGAIAQRAIPFCLSIPHPLSPLTLLRCSCERLSGCSCTADYFI